VVTGYALLALFGARGPLGSWLLDWFGLSFAFRWTGAALAAAIMGFPLLVRPIRLSLEAVDRGLEDAAHTLGASRTMSFLSVTLPMVMPGVLAGTILSFAKALGEFGATITFVSNIPGETQTLSLAIYSLLQSPAGDREALHLILASVVLAVVAVMASEWMARRVTWERGR
jgi:molybdate transport system permease protein